MSGAPERTVRGIVIARRPAGEGSVRALLYTDKLGLVHALAKSAREERSKLRAHLTEGTRGVFTLVRGSSFWRVTGAVKTENIYFTLGERVRARESAARVIGVVRQFVRGEGSDPYFFEAFWDFLHALPSVPDASLSLAECVAVFKLLTALGYVRSEDDTEGFLDAPYDAAMLERATLARPRIVAAVNEGIAASGL